MGWMRESQARMIRSSFLSSCGVEEFVYACYDAINVLGRGLPVADADSYGATTVPDSAGDEGFAGGEDLCASSISSRLNACVVADEDGQIVVLGPGPSLQGGDDVIGGGFRVEACAVFQQGG